MGDFPSVEYEVWLHGAPVACASSDDDAAARREIAHYAAIYGQDGPVEVVRVVRTPIATTEER